MKVREEKLRTIIEWSEKNEDVRVLLLTSSLVNPLALVDEFSDLDIEFVFEDNTNYISDKSWTLKFGNPIAMIEEDESCFNHKHAMKMLLYEDGVKVDFKLYSKSKFIKETQEKELPEDWDIGYWKSHATLTLLAKQDLAPFGYNMIDPLKSWCWGSILFYPFKISRFS
jgi:aminoglycoside 6-adenylyltransferase